MRGIYATTIEYVPANAPRRRGIRFRIVLAFPALSRCFAWRWPTRPASRRWFRRRRRLGPIAELGVQPRSENAGLFLRRRSIGRVQSASCRIWCQIWAEVVLTSSGSSSALCASIPAALNGLPEFPLHWTALVDASHNAAGRVIIWRRRAPRSDPRA